MNVLQQARFVTITPPAAIIDNAAVVTATIDTVGYSQLCVLVQLGATDIGITTLKLMESDDAGMSGAVDISGCVYGTSINPDTGSTSALPSATDDNGRFAFFVDLKGRRRYIDASITVGDGATGAFVTAIGILYNGNDIPNTAAERGLVSNLISPV